MSTRPSDSFSNYIGVTFTLSDGCKVATCNTTFSIFLLSQAEMAKVGRPRSRFRSPQPFSLLPIQAGWSFRTIFVIFFITIILFSELGFWGIGIQTIRMTMKLKLLLSETNEKRNESVIWGLGPFLLDVSQTLKN